MAEVIFETLTRGHRQHYKVTHFPATIGRAYDNDIILSDPSISPHHLEIDQNETGYVLKNISEENGTLLNKEQMGMLSTSIELPVTINLGDLKARLLSHKTPIEPTRIKQRTTGFFRFLSSPLWVTCLFLLTIGMIFFDRYQSIPIEKGFLFYLNQVLPALFIILGITLVIGGVSRLSTHRWEILSALGIATLSFIIPLLFDYLGHFLNYLITSDAPSSVLKNISNFLILPALLTLYMMRVHLTPWVPALGIAVLISSPFIAYYLNGAMDHLTAHTGFSPLPPYNQTLSSLDIRTAETLPLEEYFKLSDTLLSEQTAEMLKIEQEKE